MGKKKTGFREVHSETALSLSLGLFTFTTGSEEHNCSSQRLEERPLTQESPWLARGVGAVILVLKINPVIKSHECILSKRPGLRIKPRWLWSHHWSHASNVVSRQPTTIKDHFAVICGKFLRGKLLKCHFPASFEQTNNLSESMGRLCSLCVILFRLHYIYHYIHHLLTQ